MTEGKHIMVRMLIQVIIRSEEQKNKGTCKTGCT
jgi:hypothetical protein